MDKPSAWWGHVPFAFWMTAACKPRLLVELGTHYGVSYAAFCEAVARSRLATRCYAVDTWAGDAHAGFYGDDIYNELKDFHDKRYASFSELLRKSFDEACGSFEDGTIDLLHIDGYHTYEAVRHDFETWRPKLSERAIVLFHDTNVRRDDFGVWRFFGELKKELPSFEFLHGHGLGVVAVGADAPAAIRELCGLTQSDDIAAVRERFSYFGARWMVAAGENLKSAELAARLRQLEGSVAQKDAQIAQSGGDLSLAKRKAEDLSARLRQLEDSVAQKDTQIAQSEGDLSLAKGKRKTLPLVCGNSRTLSLKRMRKSRNRKATFRWRKGKPKTFPPVCGNLRTLSPRRIRKSPNIYITSIASTLRPGGGSECGSPG